jgi:bifunctional enzyme CysN/CysC
MQHALTGKPGGDLSVREQELLRVLTCGSVDDGKSTLIGRLLYDLKLIPTDQLEALELASGRAGTANNEINFSLLLDGLEAEREQGITIDVAYRSIRGPRRTFLIADSPGHEQYTRNMATAASVSDAAILLVDARKGLLPQTQRHSRIIAEFGIKHVALVINKCDLVEWSESVFRGIVEDYNSFARGLNIEHFVAIPICALAGDNVARTSERMGWYAGPTLLGWLESVNVTTDLMRRPFRFPVQWVCRPNGEFRALAGTVASGRVRRGDLIAAAGWRNGSELSRIVTMDGDREEAAAGDPVMLVLKDEIDAGRGDILCHVASAPVVADQFAATVLWLSDTTMFPGRSFLIKIGTRTVLATVTSLKYRIDVATGAHIAARTLSMNEMGLCNIGLITPVPIDAFSDNRATGAFIVIDRFTNATTGAGMIRFVLRRAANTSEQEIEVRKSARSSIKLHRPAMLWLTGLSGAGKSTIANIVERSLNARGCHTYLLDGDNLRRGLNRDLGFVEADRVENVRRVGEVARLFVDAGLIVIVSLISPFRAERLRVREQVEDREFIEIFVDTPIEVCRQRDPKGLYAKANRGEILNMTGLNSPYEPPDTPELHLCTVGSDPDTLARSIMDYLRQNRIITN